MGSFGPSAALLERTGLGGSGGFHLGVGFIRAAVGSRGGVVARLVKSMPPTGGGSGGVLGPGNCGGGVSGTSLSHLGATVSRRSSVECPSQGPVGMAGGCTVGGRLGGYLSLGGATGVGPCVGAGWRGFAGQLRGLDLEDSCAWLGAAVVAVVVGKWRAGGMSAKRLGGGGAVVPPSGLEQVAGCEGGVGSLFVPWTATSCWERGNTGAAWTGSSCWERGNTGAGTGGYWIGTGKGLVGRLGGGNMAGAAWGAGSPRTAKERLGPWLWGGWAATLATPLKARGCGGGAWIGGARIDGDLQRILTGFMARGCGVWARSLGCGLGCWQPP
ncbi:unnamed protein product [Symbiodinium sp. KB8]|nr:unnamed protein product [Symbiodinium sp. KB8]